MSIIGLGGIGAVSKKTKKLYEVYFNNDPKRDFDRIAAYSKKDAESRMKKFYPNKKVTGSKLLG